MNNKEVAHLWANQSRERATGSHFYFEGDTIYSYGSHFPIARHYKGVVLFTTKGHSKTTACHKSIVRSACSHLTVFEVSQVMDNPSGRDVKEWGEQIKFEAETAAKSRNPHAHLESLQSTVNTANDFCERFKFKTRFTMPDNLDELRERAKASAQRERKAKAERLAKFEADCAETVSKWLAGEVVTIPHQYEKVLLRARHYEHDVPQSPDVPIMQTSKGATVPLTEAEKAYRFACIMRQRGWRRNGDTYKVGDYQLDAINEQGVIAGCHRVAWDEIERFAKVQGWA